MGGTRPGTVNVLGAHSRRIGGGLVGGPPAWRACIAVRNPNLVAAASHYGVTVATCVPYDPESKSSSEATVRIAKADLVPTEANLRPEYSSSNELVIACEEFHAE